MQNANEPELIRDGKEDLAAAPMLTQAQVLVVVKLLTVIAVIGGGRAPIV